MKKIVKKKKTNQILKKYNENKKIIKTPVFSMVFGSHNVKIVSNLILDTIFILDTILFFDHRL